MSSTRIPSTNVSFNGNDFNSIVSIGLVRNALELALDMSAELGVDADRHQKWRHILAHLSGWSYHELSLPAPPRRGSQRRKAQGQSLPLHRKGHCVVAQ